MLKLFFKIVSIVSIVFKTTQESRLCSLPLLHAILAAKVLKTIETIETIFFVVEKLQILLFKALFLLLKSRAVLTLPFATGKSEEQSLPPLLHRHKIIVLLSALHEQILAVDEVVGGHSLVEGSELLLVERHATALNELAHLTL